MKKSLLAMCIASATALAALPGVASAALIQQGGGSFAQVPMYRALAFGTVSFAGNQINGVDYVSNTHPLPLAQGNSTIVANGATFTGVGRSAYAGFYAGRNYASISVTNANTSDTYYEVAGQGSATSVQFFTADAAAAYATFTWHVTGAEGNPQNLGNTTCPSGSSSCFRAATARLDFGASTQPLSQVDWLDLFEEDLDHDSLGGSLASIRYYGPGTYTYNLPIDHIGDVINLFYWSSAFAQINPGEAPAGSSFFLGADYFSTYELTNVQLYDAANNPITEWTLRDLNLAQDVFNQDGRIQPILPPPALVPEPATLALLGFALVGLAGSRRRAC